jgi:hypothetical protein
LIFCVKLHFIIWNFLIDLTIYHSMGEFLSFMSESWVLMSEFRTFMGDSSVFMGEFYEQQSFRKEQNII